MRKGVTRTTEEEAASRPLEEAELDENAGQQEPAVVADILDDEDIVPQYKDQALSSVFPDLADGGEQVHNESLRNERIVVEEPDAEDTTNHRDSPQYPGTVQFVTQNQMTHSSPHFKDQMNSILRDPSISNVSDSYVVQPSSMDTSRIPTRKTSAPPPPLNHRPIATVGQPNPAENVGQVPVEAIAIHDASEVPIVDAVNVPQSQVVATGRGQQQHRKSNCTVAMAATTVVLVVVAVSAAIVCAGGTCRSSSSSSNNTAVPTPAPTSFPTFSPAVAQERTAAILAEIRSATNQTNLTYPPAETTNSSSTDLDALALAWLIEDPSFPIDLTTENNLLRIRERYALATVLFHVTGVNDTSFLSPWILYDHCTWDAVECDVELRVTKFVYTDAPRSVSEYNGRLPPALGLLTRLAHLELSGNHLIGTIPGFLQLTALTRLSLGDNSMTGTIPTELSQLLFLERLSLHQNNLFGRIPSTIGSLTALHEIELNNNILTGPVPTEIGRLTQLTGLFMDRNRLSGTLPSSMIALGRLQYFWIHDNRFSGELPSEALNNWTQFEDGFFHNNDFAGEMPFCIGNDGNTTATVVERLVADCRKVDCLCCTHCCPTAFNGIRQSFACAIG